MNDTSFRDTKILELKKELAKRYVYIMIFILFLFTITFQSEIYLKSSFLTCYTFFGMIALYITWYVFKDRVDLDKLVKNYLIIAPLYSGGIMFVFWKYSVTSYVWLAPIPVGAYIFFSLKDVIAYSIYAIIIIIAIAILEIYFESVITFTVQQYKIRIADTFIFSSNVIIIMHLLVYSNRIRNLETISKIEKHKKIELPVLLEKEEIEHYNDIFKKIEKFMNEKKHFKNPNFSISYLSAELNYSNSYISRAIKYQNYSNFNNFLNCYRIEFVIELLNSIDLEKLTIAYIYTEAGYRSQSTFNRAFKELKGITPSQHIQALKNKK